MRNENFNVTFATQGGIYVSDTSSNAGPYCGIFAHSSDVIIASMTCAAWEGTLTSIIIPQGCFFPFPGNGATALTLTSGKATLVNA